MKEQKHLMDKTYRTAYIQPVELARTHVKTKTDKRGERKTKQKTHNHYQFNRSKQNMKEQKLIIDKNTQNNRNLD